MLSSALVISESLSSTLFFSSSALSIISRNSSAVDAFLKFFVNSSSISIIDNLLSTSRWTLSFVSGAAIRKSSVTGSPSSDSKSTPSFITIAASPGLLTAAHFPCGIAIPSPTPVVLSSSLANTCLRYPSVSLIFPLSAIRAIASLSASSLLLGAAVRDMLLLSSKSVILILFPPIL